MEELCLGAWPLPQPKPCKAVDAYMGGLWGCMFLLSVLF